MFPRSIRPRLNAGFNSLCGRKPALVEQWAFIPNLPRATNAAVTQCFYFAFNRQLQKRLLDHEAVLSFVGEPVL